MTLRARTAAALAAAGTLAAAGCDDLARESHDLDRHWTDAPCAPGLDMCGDGCVDLRSDPVHCGECGAACGAREECVEGGCARACAAGTTRCGGACVDTASDSRHCGRCDVRCAVEETCSAGLCLCEWGKVRCEDVCADLSQDEDNCGRCGLACEGAATCREGLCVEPPDGPG